jgi:hypothetical protein
MEEFMQRWMPRVIQWAPCDHATAVRYVEELTKDITAVIRTETINAIEKALNWRIEDATGSDSSSV